MKIKIKKILCNKKASGINFYSMAIIFVLCFLFAIGLHYFTLMARTKYVQEKTQLTADEIMTEYSIDMFNYIKQGKNASRVLTPQQITEIKNDIFNRFKKDFEDDIRWDVPSGSSQRFNHVGTDNRVDYYIENFTVGLREFEKGAQQGVYLWIDVDFDLTIPYTMFGEIKVPIHIESSLKGKTANVSGVNH